jgi:O-antigen ligase
MPTDLAEASRVWAEALAIVADFPIVGTGLGSFAAIEPYYKSADAASTTARSSLLQWWVESGAVGLALLLIAAAWCLVRLPAAVRRVGTADRSLVFGLIGAAASFSLYAAVNWSVELSAVAVAASAWGGTWNRWLAGGTDLFVERG